MKKLFWFTVVALFATVAGSVAVAEYTVHHPGSAVAGYTVRAMDAIYDAARRTGKVTRVEEEPKQYFAPPRTSTTDLAFTTETTPVRENPARRFSIDLDIDLPKPPAALTVQRDESPTPELAHAFMNDIEIHQLRSNSSKTPSDTADFETYDDFPIPPAAPIPPKQIVPARLTTVPPVPRFDSTVVQASHEEAKKTCKTAAECTDFTCTESIATALQCEGKKCSSCEKSCPTKELAADACGTCVPRASSFGNKVVRVDHRSSETECGSSRKCTEADCPAEACFAGDSISIHSPSVVKDTCQVACVKDRKASCESCDTTCSVRQVSCDACEVATKKSVVRHTVQTKHGNSVRTYVVELPSDSEAEDGKPRARMPLTPPPASGFTFIPVKPTEPSPPEYVTRNYSLVDFLVGYDQATKGNRADALVSFIQQTTAQDSWGAEGSDARIHYSLSKGQLFVTHSEKVHEQVRNTLDRLRELAHAEGVSFAAITPFKKAHGPIVQTSAVKEVEEQPKVPVHVDLTHDDAEVTIGNGATGIYVKAGGATMHSPSNMELTISRREDQLEKPARFTDRKRTARHVHKRNSYAVPEEEVNGPQELEHQEDVHPFLEPVNWNEAPAHQVVEPAYEQIEEKEPETTSRNNRIPFGLNFITPIGCFYYDTLESVKEKLDREQSEDISLVIPAVKWSESTEISLVIPAVRPRS